MFEEKHNLKRTLRFEHFIKSAAISAVIGTCSMVPSLVAAQTLPPTAPSVTDQSTVVPSTIEASQAGSSTIDFTILANPYFNYSEIARARASDLNSREIGTAIGIAEKAQVPTDEVINYVEDGWSFTTIEQSLGVPNQSFDGYEGKVDNYLAAYRATGVGALRTAENMEASPSSNGSMVGGSPTTDSSPLPNGNALRVLDATGNFTEFVRLIHRAGLVSTLTGPGPITVFAPTDSAFAKLPKDEIRHLWKDRSELKTALQYHIIPARIDAATALAMTSPTSPATLEGESLQVTTVNGNVEINDATVTTADIQADNGIIHAIDTVLLPPSLGYDSGSTSAGNGMAPTLTSPTTLSPNTGSTSMNPNATTPGTGMGSTDQNSTAPGTSLAPANQAVPYGGGTTSPNAMTPGTTPGSDTLNTSPSPMTPSVTPNSSGTNTTPDTGTLNTTPNATTPGATTFGGGATSTPDNSTLNTVPNTTVPSTNQDNGTLNTTPNSVAPTTPDNSGMTTTPNSATSGTTPGTNGTTSGATVPGTGTTDSTGTGMGTGTSSTGSTGSGTGTAGSSTGTGGAQ